MSDIRLIVQADDFGMCHAVNRGVREAFEEGILTQAMVMVPAPWFDESVSMAKEHGIPVGLHCTLTCEWDHMRWRPITRGGSLVLPDGTFHRTVEAARAAIDEAEAAQELVAQASLLAGRGHVPLYFDAHMGLISDYAYEYVSHRFRRPFLYFTVDPHVRLHSFEVLSPIPTAEKRDWMLTYLNALGPGTHFLQTHPGEASSELRGLVAPGSPIADWAEEYRTADLAVLTDPEIIATVERRNIRLISVADT